MTRYTSSLKGVTPLMLRGFFVGWPHPPAARTYLRLLSRSDAVVLAVDEVERRVAGFVTAITDGVLSAYVPFLEVLPPYQGRGVGKELLRRMLDRFRKLYMVDLVCDPDRQPF